MDDTSLEAPRHFRARSFVTCIMFAVVEKNLPSSSVALCFGVQKRWNQRPAQRRRGINTPQAETAAQSLASVNQYLGRWPGVCLSLVGVLFLDIGMECAGGRRRLLSRMSSRSGVIVTTVGCPA